MLAIAVAFFGLASWSGFITKIATENFGPHGLYVVKDVRSLTIHVVSDCVIFISYVGIYAMLAYFFFRERRQIPYAWFFVSCGAFIAACGFTYAMNVVILLQPLYWLAGDIKVLTAITSLSTALSIPFIFPKISKLLDEARIARHESERKLRKLADFTASILATSPFPTIVMDPDGTIAAINPAAEEMLAARKADLIGRQTPLVFLEPADVKARAAALEKSLDTSIEPGIDVLTANAIRGLAERAEWRFICSDGRRLHAELTVSALGGIGGEVAGFVLIAYDITERKRTEEYISHLAHHDALTGLPTRVLFHDRLQSALLRANRECSKVGILMIDLDNFKRVNDRMGHDVGDNLLKTIATRMREAVRGDDTVARIGGDEFVIVLERIDSIAEAAEIAKAILATMRVPVIYGRQLLSPTASVGVCLYPDHGTNADTLLKNADAAMYFAKTEGRNRYQAFDAELAAACEMKRKMETALNDALILDEFELFYQPQVSMQTGLVTGVEALIRWRSAKLGAVMPSDFIPLIEESGLIVPIGTWVLRTACAQGRQLQRLLARPLTIAVNISPRQFQQDDLPAIVRKTLSDFDLTPSTLELEITENMLVTDSRKALTVLEEVRGLDVRVAIDDFGTGFSSMAYVMRFHVDRLKIDRSFVSEMTEDPTSSAVTSSIIALAHGLNIPVVAEGVETAAHHALLYAKGCDEAQGYLYSRPVPYADLPTVIAAIEARRASSDGQTAIAGAGISAERT